MGAFGGGLQEERGLMDQNHDNNAAISGMWNIDYYHGSNKIVKASGQRLDRSHRSSI
jgi:hypothetical protein